MNELTETSVFVLQAGIGRHENAGGCEFLCAVCIAANVALS